MATLNSLALKSKVKFGSIYGKPIVWLVAAKNHSGYPSGSVTLVTNQIIKLICFDAKEPSNTYRDRRDYGNNRYIYSNLRQWLNSNAGAGQWYTAQHSADQAPDSYHVWQSKCPYDTIAGFLNGFTANDRAALLSTTLTVGKSSTDGGGTETCTDKIFPLSCTEVALSGDHVCGSKLAIFSDDSSRIATVSASAADDANFGSFANQAHSYWLRDARAESADDASSVYTKGTLIAKGAYVSDCGLRPACNLSGSLTISSTTDSDGCYTISYNTPPVISGSNGALGTFGDTPPTYQYTVTDAQGGTVSVTEKLDSTTLRTYNVSLGNKNTLTIPTATWKSLSNAGHTLTITAKDTQGATATRTQTFTKNATAPVISGSNGNLGSFGENIPSYQYTVTDAQGGTVNVTEKLDSTTLRTYKVTLGSANTLTFSADDWRKILNGSHTLTITATDPLGLTTTRTQTFTKKVTSCTFATAAALPADAMPDRCIVNVQGAFPAGSSLKVEICNNGNDASPTWENITQNALNNQKYFFTNKTKTASAWGVKLRATLSRGTASGECYISSIGGNYQ